MLFNLIFFLILLLVSWLVFVILNGRKLKKNKKNLWEVNYLVNRFGLNRRKIDYKKIIRLVNITNAFIISFVCTIISILPIKFMWQMLIAFVVLFVMMFLFYELLGIYCKKKGWKTNGKRTQKNRG